MHDDSITTSAEEENSTALLNASKDDQESLTKSPSEAGTWLSMRFGLAYLAFFGFVNIYALRVNLSVAILSMVNASYLLPTTNNTIDTCPASSFKSRQMGGEFNWDGEKRGLILGAFFYGYILTQIPGGYLASKFGGKILLGGGILSTSLLTMLTPVAARTSFISLIVLRVLEGIGEGVTFPAMHALWGAWSPPVERSRLTALTYAGSFAGTVLSQPISGLLAVSSFLGGWPSVFYVFGTVGIIWCCVWFLFAKNSPDECKGITRKELMYLKSTIQPIDTNASVPWKKIMTSSAVWAINVGHFCNNWGLYTLLTCLPLFLESVLRFDLKENGFVAALPYLVMGISISLCGILADKLRETGCLNTTQTRKIFTAVGFVGPAACLVAAGSVGCNKAAAVAFISLSTMFNGFAYSGFHANHIDISSRYAGILMGISNTFGTIPGILSPTIVGALTGKNSNHHDWLIVFYITSAVYVVGALAFALMASGREQEWNRSCSDNGKFVERNPLLACD